jgi:DNA adenine methylase
LSSTRSASSGDFVYFDPPYHPVSSTANFTSYTKQGFSFSNQKDLKTLFLELHERRCNVLLSNSNTEEILSLFDPEVFEIEIVPTRRAINCKGNQRTGHTELIISKKRER